MVQALRTVISPGRYVQGKGAIHQLGDYLKNLGSTPLIVADDLVWGLVAHDVEVSLKAADLPLHREKFNGIPSAVEVDRLVGVIKQTNADIAIAIGGGSTIDAVKASGYLAGIRWANCPTVASTDAPVQRPFGHLHRNRGIRGIPFLPAEPGPRAGRFADRRQRPGFVAHRRSRRRPGNVARGPRHPAIELEDHGRGSADPDRDRAGRTELGCVVGERAARHRCGEGPPGHPGRGKGHRGEHAAVRPRFRIGRVGRGARHSQRPHGGGSNARPRARPKGQHRLGDPAGPRGCADVRDSGFHRVHHPGGSAEYLDRGWPQRGRH